MGSGTTAVAAIKAKRNYVGYELNEDYIKKEKKRCGLKNRNEL
jgi:DNA modification methylase